MNMYRYILKVPSIAFQCTCYTLYFKDVFSNKFYALSLTFKPLDWLINWCLTSCNGDISGI